MRLVRARVRRDLVVEPRGVQIEQRRFLLNEHPDKALSWKNTHVRKPINEPRAIRVMADQRRCEQPVAHGNSLRESTGWMRLAERVARAVGNHCKRCGGECARRG